MSNPEQNLTNAGITIPTVSVPAGAAYVGYRVEGNIVYISGQLPSVDGKMLHVGHLGKDVSIEQGKETAKACVLNVLGFLKQACGGDLSKVKQALKLEILVSCVGDFKEPHVVANGASEVVKLAFGDEAGAHSRVAYGVSSLPFGAAVEVAATFALK